MELLRAIKTAASSEDGNLGPDWVQRSDDGKGWGIALPAGHAKDYTGRPFGYIRNKMSRIRWYMSVGVVFPAPFYWVPALIVIGLSIWLIAVSV